MNIGRIEANENGEYFLMIEDMSGLEELFYYGLEERLRWVARDDGTVEILFVDFNIRLGYN